MIRAFVDHQGPGVVMLDARHLGAEQPSRGGTLPAYCGLGCKN